MSISENSTLLAPARDHDGPDELLDGHPDRLEDLAVSSYDKSPYTDQKFVALDVGPSQTRFLVHRTLLEQSPVLGAKPISFLWGDKSITDVIPLPDLDESTAHTLVHYLYTGMYQTLHSYNLEKDGFVHGYKLGTCVYCAATRYKIPGLADLAKDRITFFGESLSILEVLSVARESAFPVLPEEESWFPAYLENAIRGAFSKDPELFSKPDFSDQIEGDRRFRQVVMKAILNTFTRGPLAANERGPEPSYSAGESIVEPSSTGVRRDSRIAEIPKASEVGKTSEDHASGVAPLSDATQLVEVGKDIELDFEANEPAVEVPAKPEPVTDETGWASSKTYQKMGKKPESVAGSEIDPAPKEAVPVASTLETVVEQGSPSLSEANPVVEEAGVASPRPMTDETMTVDDGGPNDAPSGSKKSKKKDKKKKKSQGAGTSVAVA
ncbi:uncharacterized protein BDR25DRAFT_299558 [Lindgomyces ingoldianus]|uniref:Uncharacterized protein n=1 Tax=Lindgomyces ingoldianus TaxID=673940 RepID=A0ACB6RG71_9PLEO|nr:uncharacterized protein BDR25DRAFT_299558 [Lindgomyces ingoldianus]KAF2477758.1 hypothetical protein BDR25DRAFT_299558 [Lindgomyces ingoldianus]